MQPIASGNPVTFKVETYDYILYYIYTYTPVTVACEAL